MYPHEAKRILILLYINAAIWTILIAVSVVNLLAYTIFVSGPALLFIIPLMYEDIKIMIKIYLADQRKNNGS